MNKRERQWNAAGLILRVQKHQRNPWFFQTDKYPCRATAQEEKSEGRFKYDVLIDNFLKMREAPEGLQVWLNPNRLRCSQSKGLLSWDWSSSLLAGVLQRSERRKMSFAAVLRTRVAIVLSTH